ncbi:hypothetical protein F4779DRAFT_595577 [Xylariaceae sp. FL0662B]|nr:hypothetical protein F4779DRAFT_595577 [Xylariaceae sp. FL0662B]
MPRQAENVCFFILVLCVNVKAIFNIYQVIDTREISNTITGQKCFLVGRECFITVKSYERGKATIRTSKHVATLAHPSLISDIHYVNS